MTPVVPMRGNRRGIRRWVWIVPLVLPVVAGLLANLWFASPLGRDWIAAKITRHIGLESHVGGASVWPWNGIVIHDVELLQSTALRTAVKQPFARITTIRLTPIWRSWLLGKRDLQAVELDSPCVVVPVEMLTDLAKSQAPATPATPPAVVQSPPPFVGPPAPPMPVPAPGLPQKLPAITLSPTAWLHLKNASFTVISASTGKSWIAITDASGSIPVGGRPAESSLLIRSISSFGERILTNVNASLDWQNPLLSLKPLETEIHGLKFIFAAKLGLLNGLPLQIEAQLPRQPLASITLPSNGHVEAEAIAANTRFRGLLLAPGTWQGDFVTETLSPSANVAGHDMKFDRGSSVTVLRGGLLSCVDARLIGDELSFLGNATLLADGRVAAALRMVAPPDSASAIASRIFPNVSQPPSLTPLATLQRAAFDLEAFGNIRQLFLRLGRDGPVVELTQRSTR